MVSSYLCAAVVSLALEAANVCDCGCCEAWSPIILFLLQEAIPR